MELDRIGFVLACHSLHSLLACGTVGKWEVGNEREERFLKCLQVEPKCCVVALIWMAQDGTRFLITLEHDASYVTKQGPCWNLWTIEQVIKWAIRESESASFYLPASCFILSSFFLPASTLSGTVQSVYFYIE